MRSRIAIVLTAVLALFLIVAGSGWYLWNRANRLKREAFTQREEQVDLGALVTRVRELNRLETAAMRVVHVSTITQSYQLVPDAIAGDELTFFAAGDVIAGIDLSQLRESDVHREPNGTIVVRLPPPQILVTRLDNRESRIMNRKTGFFRRADMHLESRARQYAEQSIRNEALKKGILPLASQNAEVKVAELLHMFGFHRVRCEAPGAAPGQG